MAASVLSADYSKFSDGNSSSDFNFSSYVGYLLGVHPFNLKFQESQMEHDNQHAGACFNSSNNNNHNQRQPVAAAAPPSAVPQYLNIPLVSLNRNVQKAFLVVFIVRFCL